MAEAWIKVARLSELPEGTTRLVDVAGTPVCLYNLGGSVCATQDTCTHAQASLSEGYVDGDMIECPLHQATFDIRTGRALTPPATEDLRTWPVDIDGDDIRVRVE